MSVNSLGFEQVSTILTDVYKQATGKEDISVLNEADFVSVATTTLATGVDPVLSAISQVLSRTIFSARSYSGILKGMRVDSVKYGSIVRKVNYCDNGIEDDERIKLVDGASIDMYKVKKPSVVQTNFYGQDLWQVRITVFRDQLNSAFESSAQFGTFISGLLVQINNEIENYHEAEIRLCLNNWITAKYDKDTDSAIHLISEYKAETGNQTITSANWKSAAEFETFAKWLFARLKTLADMFAIRSPMYSMQITGKEIMRHTPAANLKVYMNSDVMNSIEATVLSSVYHDEKLKMADWDRITYWQDPKAIMEVKGKPSYLDVTDGSIKTAAADVEIENLAGIMFDDEAMGINTFDQWQQTTPMNAAGGYYNSYWHFTDRYWNDFTEKGVLLLLD